MGSLFLCEHVSMRSEHHCGLTQPHRATSMGLNLAACSYSVLSNTATWSVRVWHCRYPLTSLFKASLWCIKEQEQSGVLGWMNESNTDLSLQWPVETMSQEFVFKLCYTVTLLKSQTLHDWMSTERWRMEEPKLSSYALMLLTWLFMPSCPSCANLKLESVG